MSDAEFIRRRTGDASACLRPIQPLISDLDGTLVAGSRAQPGLLPFLDLLRRRGIALTVVTNNTVRTPAQYSRKLAAAGADVPPEQILTAAIATAVYLQTELPPASSIFAVGESGLRVALVEAGFILVEDSAQPAAAVVVGGDRTVSYNKLKHAIRHVRAGSLHRDEPRPARAGRRRIGAGGRCAAGRDRGGCGRRADDHRQT